MYEILVILLVVVLALLLWQVVRTYFDHKTGGAFDLRTVGNLGWQTLSGLKGIGSSGQKLLAADTAEDRKKYLQKSGQRALSTLDSALSTAEAGKQAVQSEGWFSGITGWFSGKSKENKNIVKEIGQKCEEMAKRMNEISDENLKKEAQTKANAILNDLNINIEQGLLCPQIQDKIKKLDKDKLEKANARIDELLKLIEKPTTPPMTAPRTAPQPAPRTEVNTIVENILGFCSTLNNMQQRFDTNDQTELKEIFGRVKYEYNNQIDCDVLRTVLQRTSLNTLQDFDSRIQEFTKKVYEKIQSSNIQNPPLPALPKPVPALRL